MRNSCDKASDLLRVRARARGRVQLEITVSVETKTFNQKSTRKPCAIKMILANLGNEAREDAALNNKALERFQTFNIGKMPSLHPKTKGTAMAMDGQLSCQQNQSGSVSNHPQTQLPYALRPKEAAEYLPISERTLRELLSTGQIRYAKLKRAVLIPVVELETFIDQLAKNGGDR